MFVASALLEGVLIRAALNDEVNHYWQQRDADPAFQLPNTRNLRGYFDDSAPAELRAMPLGYREWTNGGLEFVVNVSERDGRRLYLVFDRTNVSRLASYYGLVPLAAVLLVLYVSTLAGLPTFAARGVADDYVGAQGPRARGRAARTSQVCSRCRFPRMQTKKSVSSPRRCCAIRSASRISWSASASSRAMPVTSCAARSR